MSILKVSVILPVYNAQKTVASALDSLLNQTGVSFEIICVNDGSSDKTTGILNEYALKNKNIHLVTQSNQGAGSARNVGLSKARGEYVFFMDADDIVSSSFLSEAIAFAEKNKLQITLFDGGIIDTENHFISKANSSFLLTLPEVFSLKMLEQTQKDNFYLEEPLVPWNKLFKRQFLLINHIYFGKTRTSEDISFNLIALGKADKIAYLPKTYYYHRINQKRSLSSKRPKDLMAIFSAVQNAEEQLLKIHPDLQYALKRYELFQCITWIRQYIGRYPISSFYKRVQNTLIRAQRMNEQRLYQSFDKPYFEIVRRQSYEETLYLSKNFALSSKKGIHFLIGYFLFSFKQLILNRVRALQFAYHVFLLRKHIQPIKPLKKRAVSVVFAVDSEYVASLSVSLQSILEYADKESFYDFIVLEKNIQEEDKLLLLKQISNYSNCSLRFWNMNSILKKIGDSFLHESTHITKTAYYRLFIPFIFSEYKKILYLDSDIILRRNIGELFYQSLKGKAMGAVRDFKLIKDLYNPLHFRFDMMKNYLKYQLGIKKTQNYINSGVLLMNIQKLNNMSFVEKTLFALWRIKEPLFHDQDVINKVCQKEIFFLPAKWNLCWHVNEDGRVFETLPPLLYQSFWEGEKNPCLIHYASSKKPWNIRSLTELSFLFWKTALKTPYASNLLAKLDEDFRESLLLKVNDEVSEKEMNMNSSTLCDNEL